MATLGSRAIAVALAAASVPAAASDKGWDTASNIARDGLVAAALAIPAVQGDWQGDLQAGASMALTFGATEGLKHAFPERRPDGSDDKSFPSGHTSVSFAAAASIEKRYGWKLGLPAFAIASFVGAARVEARKHHWYDVVAGAALGTGVGLVLTHRRNRSVRLVPWGDSGGGGVTVGFAF